MDWICIRFLKINSIPTRVQLESPIYNYPSLRKTLPFLPSHPIKPASKQLEVQHNLPLESKEQNSSIVGLSYAQLGERPTFQFSSSHKHQILLAPSHRSRQQHAQSHFICTSLISPLKLTISSFSIFYHNF